jgi:hypothetical protein
LEGMCLVVELLMKYDFLLFFNEVNDILLDYLKKFDPS